MTFSPEGSLPGWRSSHQLRYGTLPSENVCTENLTPFLKLLPCKSLSGIAALLNPHRLFDADWHGLGVHVRYLHGKGVEVRLSFQAVTDPIRHSSNGKRGELLLPSCYLIVNSYSVYAADWSLRSVFDRAIDRSCPVARSSEVRVALPDETSIVITPDPSRLGPDFASFRVSESKISSDLVFWAWQFTRPHSNQTSGHFDAMARRNKV